MAGKIGQAAICLVVVVVALVSQWPKGSQAASLKQMMIQEELDEHESNYKEIMRQLVQRLAECKCSDKLSFALNDPKFLEHTRRLVSIFRDMGEAKAKLNGKADLEKAREEGFEAGYERVFDETHDDDEDDGDLWVIPKVLEDVAKGRH